MKKRVSLFLAVAMVLSLFSTISFAETAAVVMPFDVNIQKVAADGVQVALEAHVKGIITVDGLQFKDLNGNGKLDVYEDWRANVDARVIDLISQMTLDEKLATLFNNTAGGAFTPLYPYTDEWMYGEAERFSVDGVEYTPMYHSIVMDNVTTYLNNTNGLPNEILDQTNRIQEIGESARLGIPIVLESDRSYNTWGGMVDLAHYALGTAHDSKLLYDLVYQYAQEMAAIGYQSIFHTYGQEMGSWYGNEVNYITEMAVAETKAYQDADGLSATTKHFIARGGRNNYVGAHSVAELFDSWMVPWQACIDAGTQWIMTNNSEGITPGITVPYDPATLGYLRNELGYDGVVMTDWPLFRTTTPTAEGILPDGRDLAAFTPGEIYTQMLAAGIDMFGACFVLSGTDTNYNSTTSDRFILVNWPDTLKECVENGTCDIALVETAAARVLKAKFELGLFENPYHTWADTLELFASDDYKANPFEVKNNDDIFAARKQYTNELDEQLMTKSTVLLKNDGNILPLADGAKVYVTSDSEGIAQMDAAAIAAYATVVDTMADADVVIARVTALSDASELIIDDANAAGKPIVLIVEVDNKRDEVTNYEVENCDAILMQVYRVTADHGASMGDFFPYVLPRVMADMLFGVRQPGGSLVFEIARGAADIAMEWRDLGMDTGADLKDKLYMAGIVKMNPTALLPSNMGDVLYPCSFGMTYGQDADIALDILVAPQTTEPTNGDEIVPYGQSPLGFRSATKAQKSGVPFELYCIALNKGADGYTTVNAYEGDQLLASEFVSVEGDSFCVVTLDVTLNGAGEHTITVGDMSIVVTVED